MMLFAPFAQVQRSGDATPVRRDFGFRLAATRAVVLCNFHAVPPRSAWRVDASAIS
jgi:hypothetical protein